jgi:hypothetical protein
VALGFFFGRQLPNFAKKKTLSLTGWQMRVLFQELPCQVGMDTLHHHHHPYTLKYLLWCFTLHVKTCAHLSSVIGEHLLEPVRFWKRPTISFHFLPAILVGFKKKERKI